MERPGPDDFPESNSDLNTSRSFLLASRAILPQNTVEDQRMMAFLAMPIKPINRDRFKDMPEISGRVTSVNDWKDKRNGLRVGYQFHCLSDADIVTLGKKTFASILEGPTPRAIGNLMLLAYNLRDNADQRLFGDVPAELLNTVKAEEFEFLSDLPLLKATPIANLVIAFDADTEENCRKLAIVFCYLACSYMRLYTKSDENYEKIGSHLEKRFTDFYEFRLPFENYHPTLECITVVKSQLELNSKLKNTFYNFLYAGEVCPEGMILKEFLYALHVAYAGLHPCTLFTRCMEVLKVSNRDLALILYSKMFHLELSTIAHLFTVLYDKIDGSRALQMWKFARIFDSRFLSYLQTKNCQLFTLVLAHIQRIVAPRNHQNVLSIAGIQEAGELQNSIAIEYAKRDWF